MTPKEMYDHMIMLAKANKSWEAYEIAKEIRNLPEEEILCPTMMEVVDRIYENEGEYAF